MVNYQLGKIYKLIDNTTNNIYVGSTCEKRLVRRLNGHSQSYKQYLNGNYNYVSSFEIIKNENYDIVLLELYPCNSKDELHSRERYYIELLKCVNKQIPSRTMQEYQQSNRAQLKEYKKLYRFINKEKLKKQRIEKYKENKYKDDSIDKENENITSL